MVELRDVHMQFEEKKVLDGVSLKVEPQERLHIGMVYQYSALLSSRNVRDNVALPLEELTDKSRSEIDKIVDEKLELVGMDDSKDLLPSELSGGMRKRVSIARSL